MDQTNVAKNKEYGIEVPAPITSLQSLIQAVISPKIAAITKKFTSLSSGASSGSLGGSAGVAVGDDGETENAELSNADGSSSVSSAGSGGILSSFLKLSGPILSSSSSSAKGGQSQTLSLDDSEE